MEEKPLRFSYNVANVPWCGNLAPAPFSTRWRTQVTHEIHEQIEHAGHEGGSSYLPQFIGITIAILGVVMALCSAQVGAARTELIATMVEENAAKGRYTAVANKYRNLQA